MRAVVYEQFQGPLQVQNLPDPVVPADGVVIEVKASGLCRSDWHGWQGHDADIQHLPHVPGHEFAGVIAEVGPLVKGWHVGERVTAPFMMGCGTCPQCISGNHQVCDRYYQPGFTDWGSFANYVAMPYAEVNLIRLPDELDFVAAASLGCRFVTAFWAVVQQGRLQAGEWLAVHGCGGVGLSAIMIGRAVGAQMIAVDIHDETLALAQSLGAQHLINAQMVESIPQTIAELTQGGAHVSVDALGSATTCWNSILSLRKKGRHVQIGLLVGPSANPPLPMGAVISKELEILGSHGMPPYMYPQILAMIKAGTLTPHQLVSRTITLDEVPAALSGMNAFNTSGITVIDKFV